VLLLHQRKDDSHRPAGTRSPETSWRSDVSAGGDDRAAALVKIECEICSACSSGLAPPLVDPATRAESANAPRPARGDSSAAIDRRESAAGLPAGRLMSLAHWHLRLRSSARPDPRIPSTLLIFAEGVGRARTFSRRELRTVTHRALAAHDGRRLTLIAVRTTQLPHRSCGFERRPRAR